MITSKKGRRRQSVQNLKPRQAIPEVAGLNPRPME